MANEIYQSFDSASTLYAFVYRVSDGYIYDVGDAAFEAIGTWNDARAGECDIAMTAIGDLHFADFPVVAAGNYIIQIRLQAGASPDTDDAPLSQGFMNWGGTAEVLPSDIEADIANLDADVALVATDITTLLTHEQTVKTVVPVEQPEETKARIYI